MDNYLMHYGKGHLDGGHSGRYEYGSGKDPYQHAKDWMTSYNKMKSEGLNKSEIAEAMGMSQNELNKNISYYSNAQKIGNINKAKELKEQGYNNVEIGKMLNPDNPINESTIRGWFKGDQLSKSEATRNTADLIKNEIENKGIVDIGKGVEKEIGVSSSHMANAIKVLENEGYEKHVVYIPNAMDPTKKTEVRVLAKPPVDWAEVNKNPGMIKPYTSYIEDDGYGPTRILQFPEYINQNRVYIRYSEDGGLDRDGTIELRRGVKDVSLGEQNYSQVRIAVEGDLYMKGMAYYSDDIPKGYDIVFNTNKASGTDITKVLKEMKHNPDGTINEDNPFGATIKANGQSYYEDKNGKYVLDKTKNIYIRDDGTHKDEKHYGMSVINKIKTEGDWDEYSRNLPAQFLSKQKQKLVDDQLNITELKKYAEFEDIKNIKNPAVRKYMLNDFADNCDKAAVDLKAAALPRQSSKVILPVYDIPDGQVYAPTYQNGERLYLVRFPHGSTSEIPYLTVNNNWPTGKKVVGPDSIDAIGINKKTADQLSGADFDGDSVVVIPESKHYSITHQKQFEELKDFSTDQYKIPDTPEGKTVKRLTEEQKGREMGVVSNLITDMTLQGAPKEDVAKALKHSMVVIDAVKHDLDYKRSEKDNDIERLKKEYQPNPNNKKGYGGASTLISKSKSEERIDKVRKDVVNPKTGEKEHIYSDEMKIKFHDVKVPKLDKNGNYIYEEYTTKSGKTKTRIVKETKKEPVRDADGNIVYEKVTQKSTKMAEVKDAHELSSGHPIEEAYADYANTMKALANEARKEALATGGYKVSESAKDTYANEVSSLTAHLNDAIKAHPRERYAQIVTQQTYLLEKNNNPNMTKEEGKKIREQTLATARTRLSNKNPDGTKTNKMTITDKEWEAIQAHALPATKVSEILKNTDSRRLKELALPREKREISSIQKQRIKAMQNYGYTLAEIAADLGVSTSTVNDVLNG